MGDSIEVTLKFGDKEVRLIGPEVFVRDEVRHLTASLGLGVTGPGSGVVPSCAPVPAHGEAGLVEEKQPANHAETVAVLAYALKSSGVEEFSETDMLRAYKRARLRPPKVVGQAIRDAKNLFDYVEVGSKRGTYRLSHHGERTVEFDLPRQAS
ncbi:MAG: hypothetical protein ACE141_14550 [Bryobacteraceae bacterium]